MAVTCAQIVKSEDHRAGIWVDNWTCLVKFVLYIFSKHRIANHDVSVNQLSFCRYTVKELLQLEFFAEETGIRVEIVKSSTSATEEVPADIIQLQFRVVDPKKRRIQKQRENEAVQFDYNISTDNPDDVALEMVVQFVSSFQVLSDRYSKYSIRIMCYISVLIYILHLVL